jgi:hypothetical protein
MALTDTEARKARPTTKPYKLADSGGPFSCRAGCLQRPLRDVSRAACFHIPYHRHHVGGLYLRDLNGTEVRQNVRFQPSARVVNVPKALTFLPCSIHSAATASKGFASGGAESSR